MEVYATTHKGLERITAEEMQELGGKIEKYGNGRVYFKCDEKLIKKLNYHARTCERIIVLLKSAKVTQLEDIYKEVKDIDFSFIRPSESFAVRSKRVGVHDFNSMDIARVAGDAIIKSYQSSRKKRLKVNLDSPDNIIRVELIHDLLLVGVDTTGDKGLHRRGYRVYQHPAPLNPTIAAALLRISNWRPEKILVDPMCGSGTILVEAALMGSNIPPGRIREGGKLTFNHKLKIIGIEKFRKHVKGCQETLSRLGIDFIKVIQGDAEHLDKYVQEADLIVTNPPYGIRVGRKSIIKKLYHNLLRTAKNILTENGSITLLTPQEKILKSTATKLDYKWTETPIVYGNLPVKIFKLTQEGRTWP
ncbi:MAG: class I SAM-dependent RNA methyltransferase [Methanobacteriales archaeon]|nr:class I SAM-dependent RNA methyltransferase [Methanobacteriales archaeon]